MRRIVTSLSILAAALLVPAFAHAHASLETPSAAPGPYKAVLRIPHGCDGQPTDTVRLLIPEGFVDARPMAKPGWSIAVTRGRYAKPYTVHGKPLEEGAVAVEWSGGSLPDDLFDDFTVIGTLMDVRAGDVLAFPATQTCGAKKVEWNEMPAPGADAHSLENPAPSLTIAEAPDTAADHAGHGAVPATPGGGLDITGAWARPMLPGQMAGGGYLSIVNKGTEADRLISAASPAAGVTQIHSMTMVDNVMIMRPVENGVEVPAGKTTDLQPGGLHLMFMDVPKSFAEGDSVPVTLTFEKAGAIDVMLPVQAGPPDAHGDHTAQ